MTAPMPVRRSPARRTPLRGPLPVVRKVADDEAAVVVVDDLQQKVIAVADKAEVELARLLAQIMGEWKRGWSLGAIADLLQTAPGTAADALDPSRPPRGALAEVGKAARTPAEEQLFRTLLRIMQIAAESALPDVGRFIITNPRAVRAAEAESARLVRHINDTIRHAIRAVIRQGQAGTPYLPDRPYGMTVDVMARQLRDIVGLHPRQAQAVLNYRAALDRAAAGRGTAQARGYALADSRLAVREGMTQAQIDRAVLRYSERQLAYRATTIARTETMWSANKGLLAAWQQREADGLIGPDAWIEWEVHADDALCEICESLAQEADAANADTDNGDSASGARRVSGEGASGRFSTADGVELEAPPAHPDCRCTMVIHVSGEAR